MSNYSDDLDDHDDELSDGEKQKKNDRAQAKAEQGIFDGDNEVEDLPDGAFSDDSQIYLD